MDVSWRNAFGGEGFARKSPRQGVPGRTRSMAAAHHPLPNIEHPKHLIRSSGDRPRRRAWTRTMSLGPSAWRRWAATTPRIPVVSERTSIRPSSTSPLRPADCRLLRRRRVLRPRKLHPAKPRLESKLPGLTTRCFIAKSTDAGDAFHELRMRLDTVRLFPHRERGILVFRGAVPVREFDGADVDSRRSGV